MSRMILMAAAIALGAGAGAAQADTLTDRMGGIGLEHQRSSENQYEPDSFVKWDEMDWDHNVIAHELVHSWNGKYRRGATGRTPISSCRGRSAPASSATCMAMSGRRTWRRSASAGRRRPG